MWLFVNNRLCFGYYIQITTLNNKSRKKWKRSDSDSVALMTPLTTPIFYFHQILGALTTPLTTPTTTPTPLKVKTSLLIFFSQPIPMLNRKLLNTTVNENNWSVTKCWFLGAISMYDTQQARLPAAVREMSPRSSLGEDRERRGNRA